MKPSLDLRASERPAWGMLELVDVCTGFAVADRVAKGAEVELLLCQAVTPGKFLVLYAGSVDAVVSSTAAGKEGLAAGELLDELHLPAPHRSLRDALTGRREVRMEAVGVIETRSVAAALRAADAAAKAAAVELIVLRTAMRLHGRAYFVLSGELADVQSAIAAGVEAAGDQLHSQLVLSRPHDDLERFLA